MPTLLFLHDLDEIVSDQPAAVAADLPPVPPFILVGPGCGHRPVCTLVVDADAGTLRLQCVECGAMVAVAVGDHTENPAPCPHGECRAVLYSAGRLAVYCATCVTSLAVWEVASYRPTAGCTDA